MIASVTGARAELSSISSTLGELTKRVSALAERAGSDRATGDSDADLAAELFTVERNLRGALRRLEKAAAGAR